MGMSHFGVLNAPMVTQFALMLIGLPPLLVWSVAKLRHRLDPDGRDIRLWGLAFLFISIPCARFPCAEPEPRRPM